ncbi:type 1 fimbrial protein [Burkholderia multivorans]|uniref:type 1 fimbrial protein n=1 Tax=Burkholderia multivorans TaxID=87883 RepID=UPI000CFF45B0|nr:type 1 fimbrial protein [Burkholderia multivorans]MBR8450304.1 type 1 fimbrial protein [Burkholderia multivorans]MBU9446264.1 type 1 fimbrial protein [Burkholderia multivorans]MCL4642821.1 type 1 fimbrial protein [Burkholderia multivorans]PRG35045.1 hypothetical protein C6T68_18100 [Burkholderia multivorans]UQN86576.1 type 1 fimbrial protein [Burkholderia multivorans]
MKHRVTAASFVLGASLLASSLSFAGATSGVIHFSGMIVEPPCSFALDAPAAHVRPDCPRPTAGRIEFVDAETLQPVRTTTFTQASRAIVLPTRPGGERSPMIAIVTYQ